jgi:hypothetical protein
MNTLQINQEFPQGDQESNKRLILKVNKESFRLIQRTAKVFQTDFSTAFNKLCEQLTLADPAWVKPILSLTDYEDEEKRDLIEFVANSVTLYRQEKNNPYRFNSRSSLNDLVI